MTFKFYCMRGVVDDEEVNWCECSTPSELLHAILHHPAYQNFWCLYVRLPRPGGIWAWTTVLCNVPRIGRLHFVDDRKDDLVYVEERVLRAWLLASEILERPSTAGMDWHV